MAKCTICGDNILYGKKKVCYSCLNDRETMRKKTVDFVSKRCGGFDILKMPIIQDQTKDIMLLWKENRVKFYSVLYEGKSAF